MTSPIEQMTDEELVASLDSRAVALFTQDEPGQDAYDDWDGALDRLRALLADRAALAEAGLRLANAADVYGVAYLDSDDMPPEAEELQAATSDVRNLLPAALLTKGEMGS